MKAEYNISKTIGHDDWRGMRLTLDGKEGESSKELMDRVKKEVDDWFFNTFGNVPAILDVGFGPQTIQWEKITPEDQRIEALIQDIKNETALRKEDGSGGLLAWRLLVDKYPALKPAYDEMLKKLTNERE